MFINKDFLLESDAARELFHEHAENMPIIDYHNHLSPKMIAEDSRFENMTELWLGGDHYKWRALRANGVDERYITGDAGAFEKFTKWAETLPYTMRNPLYHWSHLELKRYFDIDMLLTPSNAAEIYEICNAKLQTPDFSVRGLLKQMNVKLLCTTDDPVDSLEYHKRIAADGFEVAVLPTWRPDKVMAVDNVVDYQAYLNKLGEAADVDICNFTSLLEALRKRQLHFASMGCQLSDHGLSIFPGSDFSDAELNRIFDKLLSGQELNAIEVDIFRSGMLYHLARMNYELGWTQQFHVGAIRNNNRRLFNLLGADIGCDSIADIPVAEAMSAFFGRLDADGCLTRSVLYNLNPKDTEVMATMAYNFNDGLTTGKMQYGAAWWFLDQADGMNKQINALSSLGLLSRFVGMLTDSRSFVSFPRHEYFRRLLCNILGNDLERGLLPGSEMEFIGQMVEDICYNNANNYFKFCR